MPRRPPPSRIHILPACIPTPPRGMPRYRLPTMPPPIPLIVSASHTIIRLQTKSSWANESRNVFPKIHFTARSRPPPWVSSRPIADDAQDMRKGVDRVIRAPKAVRLVPR